MVGCFQHHQAILRFSADTDWMCYKFNSVLTLSAPGISIRSHRLRVQSNRLPPPIQMPIRSPGITCASDPLAVNQRVPSAPPRV